MQCKGTCEADSNIKHNIFCDRNIYTYYIYIYIHLFVHNFFNEQALHFIKKIL